MVLMEILKIPIEGITLTLHGDLTPLLMYLQGPNLSLVPPHKFACRDINAKLKLYAVIKIRAQFKTPQLAKFLLCRDIKFLVATYSVFGGTSHPMSTTAIISSMYYDVATTSSWRNISCCDFCLILPSILAESRHQSLSRTSQYLP